MSLMDSYAAETTEPSGNDWAATNLGRASGAG